MRCFQMVGADASLQHRANIRQTEAHRRRRKSMSITRPGRREGATQTALQPAVYYKLALALADCRPLQDSRRAASRVLRQGGEDLTDAYRGSWALKRFRGNIVMIAPVDGTINFKCIRATVWPSCHCNALINWAVFNRPVLGDCWL